MYEICIEVIETVDRQKFTSFRQLNHQFVNFSTIKYHPDNLLEQTK